MNGCDAALNKTMQVLSRRPLHIRARRVFSLSTGITHNSTPITLNLDTTCVSPAFFPPSFSQPPAESPPSTSASIPTQRCQNAGAQFFCNGINPNVCCWWGGFSWSVRFTGVLPEWGTWQGTTYPQCRHSVLGQRLLPAVREGGDFFQHRL